MGRSRRGRTGEATHRFDRRAGFQVEVGLSLAERQVKRLMAAGARAYLTKPAKVGEFLRMLDDAFAATPVSAG